MRRLKLLFVAAFAVAGIFFSMPAFAASLYLAPATGNYYVGHSFTVDVDVASPGEAMNAAGATISFPIDKLQVISVSKAGSVMNLWVQDPSFSDSDGVVNFQGVAVNPGFEGNAGKIVTITFQVKNTGTAPITFLSGSVLANDGKGTNILTGMQGATMTLSPAPAGSTPLQNFLTTTITSDPVIATGTWYNINNIAFNWTVPPGAEAVDYALTTNLQYQLPEVGRGLASGTAYDLTEVADGRWYFFISFESAGTWSAPIEQEFNIDRTPPEPFVIVPEDSGDLANKRPSFQWAANDLTSGVKDYQVKIGNGNWFEADTIRSGNAYVLPPQSLTDSRTLTVRAIDGAGNMTDASIDFQVLPPGVSCGSDSFVCRLSTFFGRWGWWFIWAFVILTFIAYGFIYRLLRWRKQSSKDLERFREELRHDLEQMEGQSSAPPGSSGADLQREHFLRGKSSLEEEIRHITEDVKKELDRLKDQQ